MPRKKPPPAEIVAKLRRVDVLLSQGRPVAEAIRTIGAAPGSPGRTSPAAASAPAGSALRAASQLAVPIAVAPAPPPVAALGAAGAHPALGAAGALRSRSAASATEPRKSPPPCSCTSSISGKVVAVTGASIGPWRKSANSPRAHALKGHPAHTENAAQNSTTNSDDNDGANAAPGAPLGGHRRSSVEVRGGRSGHWNRRQGESR